MHLYRPAGLLILIIVALNASAVVKAQSNAPVETRVITLGRILPGQGVSHPVSFENPTNKSLKVKSIQITLPFQAQEITWTIDARGTGHFSLTLDREAVDVFGTYDGLARIIFEDESVSPIEFIVSAHLVPPIEIHPAPFITASTQHGVPITESIEILNHRPDPLNLMEVNYENERCKVVLQTLSPGKHYRLNLSMSGQGETGRESHWLPIKTDDDELPYLRVMINTLLHESVYTYPETVDMGALPVKVIASPDAVAQLAQTVMVYSKDTAEFEISTSTDLDNIEIFTERGAQGDRYQLTVSLIPEKVRIGSFTGSIRVKTNNDNIRELVIPVNGLIVAQ